MGQFSSDADNERAELFAKSVRERDLDHFLIEELQASPARLTDSRQTDVRLAYCDQNGDPVAVVLVESKVADGFRLNQAEGYAREVGAWRNKLGKNRAACILAGPRNNQRISKGDHFDAFVAIDDMADILKARRDGMADGELRDRIGIRIDLLEALAGKRSNQWIPGEQQPEKIELAELYDQLVQDRLLGYTVKATAAGPRSGSRHFGTVPGLDRFHGRVLLKHRLYAGTVILEFRDCPLSQDAADRISLPQDGSIQWRWGLGRRKNTLHLQVRVPPLRQSDATSQRSQIEACLDSVRYLTGWFSDNVSALNQAIGSPLSQPR